MKDEVRHMISSDGSAVARAHVSPDISAEGEAALQSLIDTAAAQMDHEVTFLTCLRCGTADIGVNPHHEICDDYLRCRDIEIVNLKAEVVRMRPLFKAAVDLLDNVEMTESFCTTTEGMALCAAWQEVSDANA